MNSKKISNQIAIGELAQRTGLSVSAIRFYEEKGLVAAGRNAGGQRRFARSDIRRLSFVMIAQQMGFSLERIGQALTPPARSQSPFKVAMEKAGAGFSRGPGQPNRRSHTHAQPIGRLHRLRLFKP